MDKLPQHIDLSNEARRVAAPFNKCMQSDISPAISGESKIVSKLFFSESERAVRVKCG